MVHLEKEEEFNNLVKEGTVLVDFFATWCGPCKLLGPVLEDLEKEEEGLKIIKIDVDKCENLAREHGVMSIPTIEVYKDGKMVNKSLGFHNKNQLKDLIK